MDLSLFTDSPGRPWSGLFRHLHHRTLPVRSTLSRLLRRLEQRGLVEQRPDDEDQRGICVGLTERGRSLRATAAKTNAEVVDDAFAALDSADLACLSEAVGRIRPAKTGD